MKVRIKTIEQINDTPGITWKGNNIINRDTWEIILDGGYLDILGREVIAEERAYIVNDVRLNLDQRLLVPSRKN